MTQYKILAQASGEQYEKTVYSVPQNKSSVIRSINITNTSNESKTFELSIVKDSGVTEDNYVFIQDGYYSKSQDGLMWTQSSLSLPNTDSNFKYLASNGEIAIIVSKNTNKVYKSTDMVTWTQLTLQSTFLWNAVTFGKGAKANTVAVWDDTTGATAISNDLGQTWTGSTTILNSYKAPLERGNYITGGENTAGLAVAIGFGAYANSVQYSTDYVTWQTSSGLQDTEWWNSRRVVYGNGRFVVTSSYSATPVATSTDGITWIKQSLLASQRNKTYRGLIYGGGRFVTVGYYSNISLSSTDGLTWTQGTLPGVNQNWEDVAFGNGVYFATIRGNGYGASSTDGIVWTARTLPLNTRWAGITYGNGIFVIATDAGVSARSTDGITWTVSSYSYNVLQYPGPNIAYGNGKFVTASYVGLISQNSTDGITWNISTISKTGKYGYGFYYSTSKSKFIYSGRDSGFITSTDGVTWQGPEPTPNPLKLVNSSGVVNVAGRGFFAVNKFFALPSNGAFYSYSTDGVTWTDASLPLSSWSCGAYGNSNFVILYQKDSIYKSTDGISWTLVLTHGIDETFSNPSVYVSEDNKCLITSPTNSGKTLVQISSDSGNTWQSSIFENTIDFPTRTSNLSIMRYSPLIKNGLYILIGKNVVMISTDGISWKRNNVKSDVGLLGYSTPTPHSGHLESTIKLSSTTKAKDIIFNNSEIKANETLSVKSGYALSENDKIKVTGSVTVNIFGAEI